MYRAIILAGGKGSRLRPYTAVLPKPLMPVGEYSILEIIIRQLAHNNFSHITLAVNHQADIIRALFGDGSKWNVKIDYSMEDRPLSTIGPLKLIKDLPDNFLVMNGDILTDLVFKDFLQQHIEKNSLFTISAYERDHKVDYGVLELTDKKELKGFKEKPVHHYHVSMGIYALNKKILDEVPANVAFGFDHLMEKMLSKNLPVSVNSFNGHWLDIGRPDDYVQAIDDFDRLKNKFLPHE